MTRDLTCRRAAFLLGKGQIDFAQPAAAAEHDALIPRLFSTALADGGRVVLGVEAWPRDGHMRSLSSIWQYLLVINSPQWHRMRPKIHRLASSGMCACARLNISYIF